MKKLAIITTHPIQYNAPWFRLLASKKDVKVKVFYTWSQTKNGVEDKTFGKKISWDIPLLECYEYEFIENKSKKPGSHHFFGIDNPTLISSIKKFTPDVILVFGWSFKSHLKVMRYFKDKIPIWFRGDSTLLDKQHRFKTFIRKLLLTWVYSYVDKALYVGKANKAYFLKHGLRKQQLLYVPHAIDNNRFQSDEALDYLKEAYKWRGSLGFKETDIIVLFVGKLEPKKQPNFLIEALLQANTLRKEKIQLLLVGNGPLEQELKSSYMDNKYIHFLPFCNQSKMPMVYRLGDVLCLPSRGPGETWGLVVNEAMACEKPVIVTNKVGCAEDLVTNDTGFIFAHNKLQELVDIFLSIEKKSLLSKGNKARVMIKNYSFDAIVSGIRNEIDKI